MLKKAMVGEVVSQQTPETKDLKQGAGNTAPIVPSNEISLPPSPIDTSESVLVLAFGEPRWKLHFLKNGKALSEGSSHG